MLPVNIHAIIIDSCFSFGTFYIVGGRRLLITESLSWKDTVFRSLGVKYVHAIKAYREEGRPIVYADETYMHCMCVSVGFVMCVF